MTGISGNAFKGSGYGPNKYKYNGIENNYDFDLNLYETFFGILDPQIGRFFQLDPKTIFSESLYDAMGNNPVNNTDWLGNYFTWANQTVKDTYTNLRKENGNRISEYTKELANLDLNSKDGKVQGRISELTTLINKHGELNSQWNEMESSAVEFNVTNNPSSPGVMGETSFDVDNKRVNVNLGAVGTDISIMAHEFRHGYGYLNGELLAVKGRDPLYDIMDEVAGLNAGYLFADKKTATNVANGVYDLSYFKRKIMTGNAYSSLVGRDEQLTTNTSAADFIKYNPGSRISFVLGFKNNSNMTLMQAINFLNESSQKLNGKPEYYTGQLLNNK